MLLKIVAWIYRKTGYYSNYAKFKEQKYILKNIQEYYINYSQNDICKEMTFEKFVNIYRGIWQDDHGFARPFNSKTLMRKIKKKYSRKK